MYAKRYPHACRASVQGIWSHVEPHETTLTHTAHPATCRFFCDFYSAAESRHGETVRITPCSRRARSTGRRCHHMPPTDPWRVRGVGMDPCPKHAQPLHRARARAAGRSLASAHPQRMAAGPADRISDLHAQHLAAQKGTGRSSTSTHSKPASSRRCCRQLSSSRPGQVLQVAQRCGTR